jgi:hypothetical protein
MGYVGKLQLRAKAEKLRKDGFSIKEIEKRLKVSRSSVSLWVRDIKLTNEQIKKLYCNKRTGALRGCMVAATNKVEKRKELTHRLKEEGKNEVGIISKRDRFMAGVVMYFAEGDKGDKSVTFCNSDPRAIKFMMGWFREFCNVAEDKFRCSIYLHDNLNEAEAKNFWSDLIKIPLSQFRKTYFVKNNPKRFRRTKHSFGVFRITISSVNLQRKMLGWIEGVL